MPEASNKPVFLVDAYCEPIVVRVEGRACFANSASLHDFFVQMVGQGKLRFAMDLAGCTSMDDNGKNQVIRTPSARRFRIQDRGSPKQP